MPFRRWLVTLVSFLPAIACYSLIFYLSHQSRLPGPVEEGLDRFLWFKTGHVCAYTVLLVTIMYGVRSAGRIWRQTFFQKKTFWLSLGVVVILAILDEIHQSFIPGRTPRVSDIFIDTIGSGAVLFVWERYNAFLPIGQGGVTKKHGM